MCSLGHWGMPNRVRVLTVCDADRVELARRVRAKGSPARQVEPARIVLLVADIVGLYLDPPEAAVVLCVDEKSQIQALDRTAPILPLLPGLPASRTHDYRRFGTTNLYAALNLASGQVI